MATYAQMTGGGTGRKRKKLNVLDIILDRKSQEINFTLTKEELAKLLFRKMAIQESQVVKIDTSAFGKIHVELKENVKPESLSIFLYSIFEKGSEPSFTVRIIDRTHL